ncbi:MAG TPA: peptidyl-prolyl cis-trans isomerase [Solirubrobacterales bacterium]|nr:peptidyl-prolyl cis-trans isomerase [Solirubrobacterales bacterium]
MGAKAGQRGKTGRNRDAGRQRLALIVFGVLFVLLFAGFAIAQGLGAPSVPSGDVALIEDLPDDVGNISQEEFDRAFLQQVAQAKLKKDPEPGTDKFEELKTAALGELLDQAWIQGQAEELDISVTPKQVEDELATIKKQSFPSDKAYEKFLEESKYTQEDVDDRVLLQLLSTQIQEKVSGEAPKPSSEDIQAYYDAEKDSQFTTKESRDVRIVLNKDKGEVEAAKKALDADSSPDSWKKVAAKYSSDPTSKSKGGLQEGITEEFLQGPLKEAVFSSATGELVGPLEFQGNFFVVEVVKLNPGKVQNLAEAKSQIESTIGQETQQEFFSEFVTDYQVRWAQRTQCASSVTDGITKASLVDELSRRCANVKSSGRPANAPEACYEADPKTPATECPSPVTPISPALPGSVTEAKPKGEPFPQRPRPEGLGEETGEEVPTPAGVPPTGATGE